MASRFANADAGGKGRVGVALRWLVESGSYIASKVPARDRGARQPSTQRQPTQHRAEVDQLNGGKAYQAANSNGLR